MIIGMPRELAVLRVQVDSSEKRWFVLHHTYVGGEYNYDDEIIINEDDAKQLISDLQERLTRPTSDAQRCIT